MKMILEERDQFECNLRYYENCYTASEISCVDLPIAACAGYYNIEYYNYYCFNYVFSLNWSNNNPDNFYYFRNNLLLLLGLKLNNTYIENELDFIPTIRKSLEINEPLILFLRRQTLIYDQGYGDKNYDSLHGIIVSGYNKWNPTICIRDIAHIERSGVQYEGNGYGFFRLWLKESLLTEMWLESSKIDISKEYHFMVNSLKPFSRPIVYSYGDLIHQALLSSTHQNSKFVQLLMEDEFNVFTLKDDNISANVRRKFILPMKVICNGVLKATQEYDIDITPVKNFLREYFNKRLISINKLCLLAKREEYYRLKEIKKELLNILLELDIHLFNLMRDIDKRYMIQ